VLLFHEGVKDRLKSSLKVSGVQDSNGFFGASMKRRIAQNQAHFVRIRRQNAFQHRIKGAAPLASWVKELDDRDPAGGRTQDRRVRRNL
jgi:hypothetical protein